VLSPAVKSITFSYKIMLARGLIMSYSVVVIVIANYIEHLLEKYLEFVGHRDVVCACMSMCLIGKMSL
jgi:hypothetical protein